MKNFYLSTKSLKSLTKYILLVVMAVFLNANSLFAQCTTTDMITANGASFNGSGTGGICLLCSVNNEPNVVDANLTNFASISIPVGLAGYGYLRVKLPKTYPAGTRIGWIADVNGGIAGAFNSVTLIARKAGAVVATQSSGSLINILGIGGGRNVNTVFCSDFDEVEIRMGSLVGALANYKIYYAYVNEGCLFPVQCNLAPATPEICGDGIDNDGDGLIDNEDTCLACNAGGKSPILSATTKSNTCPTLTADLTTITSSNTPAGTALEWHTGTPATAANKVGTPGAVTSGTYYAVFYDAVNNCYSNNYSNVGSTAVTVTTSPCPVAGTIDCSKTQIFSAPVVGQPGQKSLLVQVNVTAPGCFTPLSVSGSGLSIANNVTQLCATTTGLKNFVIPVDYNGGALGTVNFTVGSAGSCSADLTKPPKKAITDIWTLDCVPTVAPSLK